MQNLIRQAPSYPARPMTAPLQRKIDFAAMPQALPATPKM
jgi:hypothetical protein